MNKYKYIELQDRFPYKSVKFEIPKGISTIYGLNKTDPNSTNSNGAGKSFLVSQIGETQHHEVIGGKLEDKVKEGHAKLCIENYQGKNIEIVQQGSKREVLVDGKVVTRTIPMAKKEIQRLIPISASDFEAYVYVDCRSGHPLVKGDSDRRKKFFTKFFNIHKLDEEKKVILAKLRELKSVRASYKEAKQSYDEFKDILSKKDSLDDLKTALDTTQVKLESLQEKQINYQEYARYTLFLKSAKPHLSVVKSECELNEDALQEFSDTLDEKIKALRKTLELAREYKDYQSSLKRYDAAVLKIPEVLYKEFKDAPLDGLETAFDKAQTLNRTVSKHQHRLDELTLKKPAKVDAAPVDIGTLETSREKLEHQLKHAKQFGSGVCNTCGQDVKISDPKELKAKLRKVEDQLCSAQDYSKYLRKLKEFKEQEELRDELTGSLKEAKKKLKSVSQAANAYEFFRKLPDRPAKFNGKAIDGADVQGKLDKLRELRSSVQFLMPSIDLLENAPKESPDHSSDIQKLTDKLYRIKSDIEVVRTYRERLKSIKTRLKKYKNQLEHEADLKLIYEAYQDKAMKRMVVDQISAILMTHVNKYADMVFPEKYTFEIVWNNKFRILCHRKYGNRIRTSDVRKLSGAESTQFTLIMILSLLAFVPAHKRSSLLILDEPAGSMHEETRQRMIPFLKIVQSMIPSIVIVTPKTDEHYPNAKPFTVIKEAGQSRLVKGHPSEVK